MTDFQKITHDFLARKSELPKLLVVVGPTASGKTDFACELAENFDGEIVNADSRQIYREVDLGTAKPTAEELARARHHLVSEFPPDSKVTTAEYRRLAEEKIAEIHARKKLPILAGSHTLLISAIVENFEFPAAGDPAVREKLTKEWQADPQKFWERIATADPDFAEKTSPQNGAHLVRAAERLFEIGEQPQKNTRKFEVLIFGLKVDREKLYEKINQRAEKMMADGLLDETRELAKKYDRQTPALRGHGYRELLDFLNGEKDLETAVEEIKRDTRNYAKRQQTWLRNCSFADEIVWIDKK